MALVKVAGHGLKGWLWQRVTGLFILGYLLVFALRWWLDAPLPEAASWRAWFSPWPFRVATLLFFLAMNYHAWLGVKEILMDYIPHQKWRNRLQKLSLLLVLIYASWAMLIVWRI